MCVYASDQQHCHWESTPVKHGTPAAGKRRNSYAQYDSSSQEPASHVDDRPGVGGAGGEVAPEPTSSSASLMEEVCNAGFWPLVTVGGRECDPRAVSAGSFSQLTKFTHAN